MNLQTAIQQHLQQLPIFQRWPEVQRVFERAASQPQRDWALPGCVCVAVGGAAEQALLGAAALACLQVSIILIDDLLDADPRGEHHRLEAPAVANLAAAFQATALEAILQSNLAPAIQIRVVRSLNTMLEDVAFGQHLDTLALADEAHYWRVTGLKSGAFFGAAWEVGALLGGASAEQVQQLRHVGELYGEIIQIHDDLSDSLAATAGPDWTQRRFTLPLLFAQIVDHPERERFRQLRTEANDPSALAEAQDILIRCGAISYGLHELMARDERARAGLQAAWLVNVSGLNEILDEVMKPVRDLLAMVSAQGGDQPHVLRFGDGGGAVAHPEAQVSGGEQVAAGGILHAEALG
ncbi:MAG: polyprenyl synthetase family protein [Anaerolineales bacterium]